MLYYQLYIITVLFLYYIALMQASVLRAGPKLTACAALPAGMPYPSNLDAGILGLQKGSLHCEGGCRHTTQYGTQGPHPELMLPSVMLFDTIMATT
jgi:hypothetical protein